MRPVSGADLLHDANTALYSGDEFAFEPKINGWRGTLNTGTRQMFNRHGEKLSIEGEFDDAITKLCSFWKLPHLLDVEAMDRRHGYAKGTLIVLDLMLPVLSYDRRREFILPKLPVFNPYFPPTDPNEAWLIPSMGYADAVRFWNQAPMINGMLDCIYYEGVVAKRRSSSYNLQTRSSSEESPAWVKHRFTSQ